MSRSLAERPWPWSSPSIDARGDVPRQPRALAPRAGRPRRGDRGRRLARRDRRRDRGRLPASPPAAPPPGPARPRALARRPGGDRRPAGRVLDGADGPGRGLAPGHARPARGDGSGRRGRADRARRSGCSATDRAVYLLRYVNYLPAADRPGAHRAAGRQRRLSPRPSGRARVALGRRLLGGRGSPGPPRTGRTAGHGRRRRSSPSRSGRASSRCSASGTPTPATTARAGHGGLGTAARLARIAAAPAGPGRAAAAGSSPRCRRGDNRCGPWLPACPTCSLCWRPGRWARRGGWERGSCVAALECRDKLSTNVSSRV